jgi:hypothetical protein
MTKKDFILVGAAFRKKYLWLASQPGAEDAADEVIALAGTLADDLGAAFPRFNRGRWLDYITGECGPNGEKP